MFKIGKTEMRLLLKKHLENKRAECERDEQSNNIRISSLRPKVDEDDLEFEVRKSRIIEDSNQDIMYQKSKIEAVQYALILNDRQSESVEYSVTLHDIMDAFSTWY